MGSALGRPPWGGAVRESFLEEMGLKGQSGVEVGETSMYAGREKGGGLAWGNQEDAGRTCAGLILSFSVRDALWNG